MIKQLVTLGVFLLLIVSMGCVLQDPRENPAYSVFPEILLDYDFDASETGIWVKSALSDFKYDSILLEVINDDKNEKVIIQENNTYCIYTYTQLLRFEVVITVIFEDKTFNMHRNVEIDFIEDKIEITIFDRDKETEELIHENDLPYKKVLDEI